MARSGACADFQYGNRTISLVWFVQRTRFQAAGRHVCENNENAPIGIEPHQIERESHVRHPNRMSSACLPLQQQSVNVQPFAVRQTGRPCAGRFRNFHDKRSIRRFNSGSGQSAAFDNHPSGPRNQRESESAHNDGSTEAVGGRVRQLHDPGGHWHAEIRNR